ncbi:MAG: hydrogenase/urease maturation nickel metallochaperone HypA [Candidatus Omnitrophota bacterium]
MHEHSLIKNMLDVVERVKKDQGSREVAGVTVELPEFGALNEEHFRFHFNEAIKNTPWEDLQLEIVRVSFGVDAKLTHVSFKE